MYQNYMEDIIIILLMILYWLIFNDEGEI